jgi:hypothetical protein
MGGLASPAPGCKLEMLEFQFYTEIEEILLKQ